MSQTISALAGSLGLRADTLRYYERLGLLRPSDRTTAGYRLYDDEAAERLRFIKDAQRMGLRLLDIKELLEVRDRGRCPCGHTETLVGQRLAEVEAKIVQLDALRGHLLDLQRRNNECLAASPDEWWCAMKTNGGDA
jgi:DNA-binding transcriptional MerR regulator